MASESPHKDMDRSENKDSNTLHEADKSGNPNNSPAREQNAQTSVAAHFMTVQSTISRKRKHTIESGGDVDGDAALPEPPSASSIEIDIYNHTEATLKNKAMKAEQDFVTAKVKATKLDEDAQRAKRKLYVKTTLKSGIYAKAEEDAQKAMQTAQVKADVVKEIGAKIQQDISKAETVAKQKLELAENAAQEARAKDTERRKAVTQLLMLRASANRPTIETD